MNYLKHYKQLIRNCTIRQEKNCIIGYKEKHHIIPKCLIIHKPKKVWNGSWNLVYLTAKEHFIAHMLLWKHYKSIFGEKDERTLKLLCALVIFCKGKDRRLLNSKQYEKVRIYFSNGISGDKNPMYGKVGANKGKTGILSPLYGRKRPKHSKWMKENRDKYLNTYNYWSGKVGPNYGKLMSNDTKQKISNTLLSKNKSFWTNETRRNKLSQSHKGKKLSNNHKDNISKSKLNKPIFKTRKNFLITHSDGTENIINGIKNICTTYNISKSTIYKLINKKINSFDNIVGIIRIP